MRAPGSARHDPAWNARKQTAPHGKAVGENACARDRLRDCTTPHKLRCSTNSAIRARLTSDEIEQTPVLHPRAALVQSSSLPEIPITFWLSTAGSCMGGFRTPSAPETLQPTRSFIGSLTSPVSGHCSTGRTKRTGTLCSRYLSSQIAGSVVNFKAAVCSLDRRHDLEPVEAEMSGMGNAIGRAYGAEDIGDLERGRHGLSSRASCVSSGLCLHRSACPPSAP